MGLIDCNALGETDCDVLKDTEGEVDGDFADCSFEGDVIRLIDSDMLGEV